MFTLNKPVQGDTNWYQPVTDNWNAIETALRANAGAIPFSDGATLTSDPNNLFWDNSNQRLGIGTTGPDRRLDVLDATNPQLRLTQADNSAYTELQANSSGHLLINPSGINVGIGATPTSIFHVRSNSGDTYITVDSLASSTNFRGIIFASSGSPAAYVLCQPNTLGTNSSLQFFVGGGSSANIQQTIYTNGNYVLNNAAVATNATDGFLYVATCAGTPTGTPTTFTGRAPIVIDTTNNKLYFYSGGSWRDAGP